MKFRVVLNDEKLAQARAYTGIQDVNALVTLGLEELIDREIQREKFKREFGNGRAKLPPKKLKRK